MTARPASLELRYRDDRVREAVLGFPGGSSLRIALSRLVEAPELMSCLSTEDRQTVAALVLSGGADA